MPEPLRRSPESYGPACNASPLIVLARASHLHILRELYGDDRLARRCARALAIPVRGTLGVVLLAKKRGIIPAARPVAESLRNAGLFVSADLLESALQLVGE